MSEGVLQFLIVFLCTFCALAVITDAHRRGMNAPLWGLLTFLFSILALPVYFAIRKPLASRAAGKLESSSGRHRAPKGLKLGS